MLLPEEFPIRAPLIEVSGVSVVRGSTRVLEDFSISVEEGGHLAILGPNGCGKSTLVRTLTRELYPYDGKGSVRICGVDRWVISELRTVLGVVSEEPRVQLLGDPTGLELTVSGLLGTYGVIAQHQVTREMWERAVSALDMVFATHLQSKEVNAMSTGERRRCWIARALVSKPKGLILDEPTNGLDMRAADEFHQLMSQLARAGITLVLITHHLEEIIPEIDRVVLMKDGRIVSDGPPERVLTAEKLANLFSISNPDMIRSIEQRLSHRMARTPSPVELATNR